MTHTSFKMHYLIATPQLQHSYFERSVILLLEHNEEGAMGVVINKEASLSTQELCEQLQLKQAIKTQLRITQGGPMAVERGLILFSNSAINIPQSITLTERLSLTSSTKILPMLADTGGPKQALLALGYSGWEAGQLEQELMENSWLTLPADDTTLFNIEAEYLLNHITSRAGINYNHLVASVGHA